MNEIINPLKWNALQTKLRQKYPELTDADLHCPHGKERDMLRMVEYKLQKTKKEMALIIAEL